MVNFNNDSKDPVVSNAGSTNPVPQRSAAIPVENIKANTIPGVAAVQAQPQDISEVADAKQKRIEFLNAKSDRTLEEGLELQELELGVKDSQELNAGITSETVHKQQEVLRENERRIKEANEKREDAQ